MFDFEVWESYIINSYKKDYFTILRYFISS